MTDIARLRIRATSKRDGFVWVRHMWRDGSMHWHGESGEDTPSPGYILDAYAAYAASAGFPWMQRRA